MIRRAATTAVAMVLAVVLVACSGADESTPTGDSTAGGTPTGTGTGTGTGATSGGSPAPYLPVPAGVVLTDPGSELGLGESATIAWRLAKGGDGDVGVLSVKVRTFVRADIKALQDWQLDPAGRRSALYYVTVTVANAGGADLGGVRIPLYAVDESGAFVESSGFKTDFDPCPSPALPDDFATGDKVTVCQAYLVPQRRDLSAVAFLPTPRFNPVTWVGKVTQAKPPKKPEKQG